MTPEQRKMARHALGLTDGRKTSYRNRYSAGIGTTQNDAWDDLARQGLAERGHIGIAIVGYCLTDLGAQMALEPGETLDPEDFPLVSPADRGCT